MTNQSPWTDEGFKELGSIQLPSVMSNCPFCGHKPDLSDPDTVHPTGIGWIQRDGYREYTSSLGLPLANRCYVFNCVTTSGGCGAQVHQDSLPEVLRAWNRRTP